MFIIPVSCILFGCVDTPLIISNDPLTSYAEHFTKQTKKVDKVKKSCYVEGVFFVECPR
jgi:hypothetical protein